MVMDTVTLPSSPAWPAVSYEKRDWEREAAVDQSRRAALRERGPYEAAVPPFIAQLALPPLDDETVVAAEEAVIELGRFDGEVGAVAAPFSAILLRSESAASSEIEQLT